MSLCTYAPLTAKVCQGMLRSSFGSLKVRFGSLRTVPNECQGLLRNVPNECQGLLRNVPNECQGLLIAHAAFCYCFPPPLLFLRIRSGFLWSRCFTSFDDDLQSQADPRPIKYKAPGLQSSDTPSRTHIC